jgi:hypothetical protein
MARYPSSKEAVCKTAIHGCKSHPGLRIWGEWRNGLRTTLKMLRSQDHVGSNPTSPIILSMCGFESHPGHKNQSKPKSPAERGAFCEAL